MNEAVAAYDALALRYDSLRPANPILKIMRSRSFRAVESSMPRSGRVLDVGCGTGEEAALLAARRPALRVEAVDPSARMVEIARNRGIRASCLGARDVARVGGTLDGAWSSFALSYEPRLDDALGALAGLLRPSAPLVVALRNRWCAWEWWSLPARVTNRYRHKVGDARVRVFHRSLAEIASSLDRNGFETVEAQALPLLLPPPRYGGALRGVAALSRADERLSRLPVLRGCGDHTLIVARRR